MSALDPDIEKQQLPLSTPPNLQSINTHPSEPLSSPTSNTSSNTSDENEHEIDESQETLTATNTQASGHHPEYIRRVQTHHSQYLGTV
jgi:hypothetical protein